MQTAKSKVPQRPKELKTVYATQTKISGFFIKPKEAKQDEPVEQPVVAPAPLQEPANHDLLSDANPNPPRARTPHLNLHLPENNAEQRVEREVIVIDDSPLRPDPPSIQINGQRALFPAPNRPSTAVKEVKEPHPFFARAGAHSVTSNKRVEQQPKVLVANELPLWPTAETMHCGVLPLDTTGQARPFPKKSKEAADWPGDNKGLTSLDEEPAPLIFNLPMRRPELTSSEALETIPETHLTNPAISRLISQQTLSFPPHRIWNDKYAPRKAEQILHNTSRALYLQQWLRALAVQMDNPEDTQEARGVKRPRPKVQRDVGSKRGRKRQKVSNDPFGGLDDFIADDDEWDSEAEEQEDDGFLSIGEDIPRASTVSSPVSSRSLSPLPPPLIVVPRGTRSRPSARLVIESSPPSPPTAVPPEVAPSEKSDSGEADDELLSLTERLTNTILLTGPCGTGKTAAVYACAEELKWKVFEFFPGIGKRSGAGLTAEVGGTGDNHRVGGVDREHGSKSSQTLGFLTSPSKKRALSQPLSEADIQDVRQSLILVEEADILYQSDGNLWPTLINFIRKSRRPVILTCNDVSLIPVTEIPLQTVLEFKPCDVELATSYLQAISLAEGRPIERNLAREIYTDNAVFLPMAADVPDQPMLPVPSQGSLVHPDLKRAINHLQISLITACDTAGVVYDVPDGFWDWSQQPAVMPDTIVEVPGVNQRKCSSIEDLETILQLGDLADSISFGDAHVDRRTKVLLELGSIDRVEPVSDDPIGPLPDDTIGYTLLNKSQEPEEAFGVALCPRDYDMAVRVAYHARLQLEKRGYGEIARRELVPWTVTRSSSSLSNRDGKFGMRWGKNTLQLALARSEYQGRIVKALDEKIVLSSVLLPRPGCVLDYIPWMQETVRGMQGELGWMSGEASRVLLTEALVSPEDGWLHLG